jgi:ribosomal protein S18 acetylase RimI-like enzyme
VVEQITFRLSTNPFTQQTYGFIEDLYIAPPFRRRGEASELARAAFVELSRQGAHRIQADVLVHNEQGLFNHGALPEHEARIKRLSPL